MPEEKTPTFNGKFDREVEHTLSTLSRRTLLACIGDGARGIWKYFESHRLAKIGKRLGRKALADVGSIVRPDTVLKWFRKLVAKEFDGAKKRRSPGRPRVNPEIEELVLRFAEENPTWGYDRIQGALANLGHEISDQVGTF